MVRSPQHRCLHLRLRSTLEQQLLYCTIFLIVCVLTQTYLLMNAKAGDSLPFPTPRHYRQHHKCNFNIIPFVTNELATAQRLLYSNNSFVRFGDLDIDLINGISWPNQKASKELSSQLSHILTHPIPNLFIGIYDPFSSQSRTPVHHQDWLLDNDRYRQFLLQYTSADQEYLSTIVSSPFILNRNTSCLPVRLIYDTLRMIWKDKDIVLLRGANGQVYDYDVYDTARNQTIIYAPRYQAYQQYQVLLTELMSERADKLYILSAGPVAKLLTYDLTRSGRRALDLGHLAKDYDLYMKNNQEPIHTFFQD